MDGAIFPSIILTYHDKEVWFNINGNNVEIWEREYRKGRSDLKKYRPIYNFKGLGVLLELLKYKSE